MEESLCGSGVRDGTDSPMKRANVACAFASTRLRRNRARLPVASSRLPRQESRRSTRGGAQQICGRELADRGVAPLPGRVDSLRRRRGERGACNQPHEGRCGHGCGQ